MSQSSLVPAFALIITEMQTDVIFLFVVTQKFKNTGTVVISQSTRRKSSLSKMTLSTITAEREFVRPRIVHQKSQSFARRRLMPSCFQAFPGAGPPANSEGPRLSDGLGDTGPSCMRGLKVVSPSQAGQASDWRSRRHAADTRHGTPVQRRPRRRHDVSATPGTTTLSQHGTPFHVFERRLQPKKKPSATTGGTCMTHRWQGLT